MDSKKALRQLRALEGHGKLLRLAAEWHKPWQSLISTILSARTRDDKTIEVSNVLYKKYPGVEKLAGARYSDVAEIIKPVNFYKTKAKNIIACAKMLVSRYNGKVPHDFDKLIELPGVGRKTANVFLAESGHAAIGVDTHVAYISRKIGWTKNTKVEKIEEDLKNLFPEKYWRSINYVLVRFGQTHKSRRKQDEIIAGLRRMR